MNIQPTHVSAPSTEMYWRKEVCPHHGKKVLLRTIGGVCVEGQWYGLLNEYFTGWCPMPAGDAPSNVPNITPILNWFKEAVPFPTDKNRAVQLGVHIEEFAEMFDALKLSHLSEYLHGVARIHKSTLTISVDEPALDRVELLDSLCDQVVTAIGVAHMMGMDILGALAEVNASNWSKFDENGKPIFDANGKIAKNQATYFKPNLTKFI